jgi:predicted phosphodiesterase
VTRTRRTAAVALVLALAACVSARPAPDPTGARLGPWLGVVGKDRFRVLWETEAPAPTTLRWGDEPGCPSVLEDPDPVARHEATVAGLKPGTTYWYRVGSGEAVAVRTRPEAPGPVRFAVVGDTHSTAGAHARLVREIADEAPDFVVHTGDLSLRDGKNEGGGEEAFFRVEAPLLRSLPFFPVLGNHDGEGERFVELFVAPRDAGHRTYYLETWGPVALLALDSGEPFDARSEQGRWIAGTLAALERDPAIRFRVVAMHWGPYDSGSAHGPNVEARHSLVPLLERHGVDVVLSGHDHVYERSSAGGVRYVLTGGGGGGARKPHVVLGSPYTEAEASGFHHGLVEADARELRFTAREARSGKVLDEFRVAARVRAP